jgi:hypothetical protein
VAPSPEGDLEGIQIRVYKFTPFTVLELWLVTLSRGQGVVGWGGRCWGAVAVACMAKITHSCVGKWWHPLFDAICFSQGVIFLSGVNKPNGNLTKETFILSPPFRSHTPHQAARRTKKKRAARANSNVFARFDQDQIAEFQEVNQFH